MKRKNIKTIASILIGVSMLGTLLAGCGGSDSTATSEGTVQTTAQAGQSTSSSTEKIHVNVAMGTGYAPFDYIDENENPAGYDYETFLLIQEKLSDKYEFEFTPEAFANLLVGLETGTYDMTVNHWGYTKERAEKYLYATEGNMYINYFVVGHVEGRDEITDLESCAGLTGVVQTGTKADTMLNNWNAEHPDKAVVIANVEDLSVATAGLESGLYDFYMASTYDMQSFNNNYGNILVYSDNVDDYIEVENPGILWIYAKGQDELAADVDKAMAELRADGTLSELCIKWLGADYTAKIE